MKLNNLKYSLLDIIAMNPYHFYNALFALCIKTLQMDKTKNCTCLHISSIC